MRLGERERVAIKELVETTGETSPVSIRTVVKACKPWDDDSGASYPEAAELVDFKDSWVGNRVRDWGRGEYRNLVAGPNGDSA